MDVVLDSGGLTAWANPRPPSELLELLELVATSGGAVVVPTVIVVESTTGRHQEDAPVNHRLKRAICEPCTLERARQGARLRFRCDRDVSAVDAVVAATAAYRGHAAVVTSDPNDLQALLAVAETPRPVLGV
jgi:predicted nucleic acid-binding protein